MTLTAVPSEARTRTRRMAGPAATTAGLAVATLALHVRDPHVRGSWGFCPLALLGISCPGCGSLRAVHDLTNGDIAAAASSNLLLLVAVPFVVVALGGWTLDAWTGRQRVFTLPPWPWVVVGGAAVVVFTVARNLPGSWLAP